MARSGITAGIGGALAAIALVVGLVFFLGNRDSDQKSASATQDTTASIMQESQDKQMKTTIVDAAAASPDFSTLVTAVKAADLTGPLTGDKKLTVFAPTNSAFEKLPAGTIDTLVQPENKQALASILTYHVVEGEVLSGQLANGQVVKTLNGAELTVSLGDGMIYLTDTKGGRAMVTKADMKVDNGVIHAIDKVVMPL